VLTLETADRLAPVDSQALIRAIVNLLDRTASLLCERLAYAWPITCAWSRPTKQNRRRSNIPALVAGPRLAPSR
jgi:hypothetical protein